MYGLLIVLLASGWHKADSFIPNAYERGNEYYEKGDYQSALEAFHQAIDQKEVITQRYPWIQFKIGYCQYQVKEYDKAIRTFEENIPSLQIVDDYVRYFLIKSRLATGDTVVAIDLLNDFIRRYFESPIIPLVDSLSAEVYFHLGRYHLAANYYNKQLRYSYFDKGDIYAKLLKIEEIRGNTNGIEEIAFKLIEKYPFHPRSADAYLELLKILGSRIPETKFERLYDYVIETRQFDKAERLLRFQVNSSGETPLTRWLKIEILYKQDKYDEMLKACLEKRKTFSQLKYLSKIDLYIARCHLRLGEVEESIKAYAIFQKRYPHAPISPEVLWKIAWLYEELKDYSMARIYYSSLIATYPRSEFVSEARFRIGLSYYRDGNYSMARVTWHKSLSLEKSQYEKPRHRYWIAKTYLQEKDFVNYLRELEPLTATPFLSYYNLKAYLLTTDIKEDHHNIDSLLWEMHHDQTSHLGEFIGYLKRPLVVEEILGDIFARYEVNNDINNNVKSTWEYGFALAELHEKLRNYGKAYRLFRRVYNRYFSRQEWKEMIFVFKRLYPLYYDVEISRNAEKRGLVPEIIWAIIKQESAFASQIISYANAYGLMQIIPPTAKQIAKQLGMEIKDIRLLYDPSINIDMGTYYLTELLKRYQWNLYYALAAYNAGPHRVDRWQNIINTSDDDFFMENIEFSQTREYVRVVIQYYWTYYLILHPQEIPNDIFSFPRKLSREKWYNGLIRN